MIRQYRPDDLPALRAVCLLTGSDGRDATGRWSTDDLLPDLFLEPYAVLEPEHVWVVEQDARPVGYLVSAFDTPAFVGRWRTDWTPRFAKRYGTTAENPAEQWLRDLGYEPERMLVPQADAFPAHLHIDLLPEAQGSGWGRRLMRELGLAAVASGVPGIHLAMSRDNAAAGAFYERLGFRDLGNVDDDPRLMGIDPTLLA